MEQERAPRRWWPALAPLALLVIGISLITPAGRHQWALSLFKQPTRFTALSFNKPWALPAEARVRQPIAISFTIGNHEGRAVGYQYVLAEEAAGKSRTLQQASKVVQAGATWTVSTTVRPTCTSSPCKVEVSLAGHPEIIDFLLYLTGGTDRGSRHRQSGSGQRAG